jgi:hypothetical protein
VSTSPDAGALSRDARREAVRQFDDQGLSARAIATRLGVGKDTVRRDLEALRQARHRPRLCQTTAHQCAPTGSPWCSTAHSARTLPYSPKQGESPGAAVLRLEQLAHVHLHRDLPACAAKSMMSPECVARSQ